MMEWVAVPVAGWACVQFLMLLWLARYRWKSHRVESAIYQPKVSILIAVRNEEKELPNLLASLNALDYPTELLEIWIADDESLDQTPLLLAQWQDQGNNRKVIRIEGELLKKYHGNGKANALSLLAKQATGDLFFFTDGDCQVPSSWIQAGVQSIQGKVGILLGVTEVKPHSFFGKMQRLDWRMTLGIIKVVTDLNLPTTGLGNNMVITREAYEQSGGFASLPPSLTEDLEISKAIRKAGFLIAQEVSEEMLVQTKEEYSWKALLQQRKRWIGGVMTLSLPWKILLGLQVFFFPAIFWLLVNQFEIGFGVWLSKIFLQGLFIEFFAKKTRQQVGVLELFVFDFYQILSLSLTILYYFWPSSVKWKARNYP